MEAQTREKKLTQIRESLSSEGLLELIFEGLDEKQVQNLACFKVGPITSIADYMVIGTAGSFTQMKVLLEHITRKVRGKGLRPLNRGEAKSEIWNLVDFGVVVVHLFSPEGRKHYDLDSLWAEAEKIEPTKDSPL
jgi:ribosome-associated protein